MMFSIQCMVEEKKIAKALVALNGLALDLRVLPVTNAKPEKGKVVESGEGHSAYDYILDWLRINRPEEINTKEMRQIVEGHGLSHGSYSHPLSLLIKERILKLKGKGTAGKPNIYHVQLKD